jgi:hypothetical protein
MDDRHLLVVRIGDAIFRDVAGPRPFPEAIARWNTLDLAHREGRLVAIEARASGEYRAHPAVPLTARWLAQRSPGDLIGELAVERLPLIILRSLASDDGGSADPDEPVRCWAHAHGFRIDGLGWIRETRPAGSLGEPLVQGWPAFAARYLPQGSLLVLAGRYLLAEEASVPGA